MLTEEEFREELHRRVGAGLEEVHAPGGLVDAVRVRQSRRTALLRGSAAASVAAAVVAVVSVTAFWPHSGSSGPTKPAGSAAPSSRVSPSAGPAPDPSTPVIDMSGVAPLVTSGPCKGLAVAVYRDAGVQHPPVTALTSAGALFDVRGVSLLSFKAAGPCVDRLSFVQRTATFGNSADVPYSFPDNEGAVVTNDSPQNQTGVVQFFLDCKGLVCSGSGPALATLTVHVRGTAPASASVPFEPVPTPIPLPPGETVTIPSVIGMSPDLARQALDAAGVNGGGSNAVGGGGKVISQDPPAGSVVLKGSNDDVFITGAAPFRPGPAGRHPAAPPTSGQSAPASAEPSQASMSAVPSVAQPSLPGSPVEVPFIHWPQRGELVNTLDALDAEAAWDVAKGPHYDVRIVYAGAVDGMQGVILEGSLRMALLVRPAKGEPFTVLDDRFVRQNGGLRELSALGRPTLKNGELAPYQVAIAVVHDGDVVKVTSPGLQQIGPSSYVTIARLPLSATRSNTSLDITGGKATVSVPIDPPTT